MDNWIYRSLHLKIRGGEGIRINFLSQSLHQGSSYNSNTLACAGNNFIFLFQQDLLHTTLTEMNRETCILLNPELDLQIWTMTARNNWTMKSWCEGIHSGFGTVPIVSESYPDLCDQQSLKFGKGGSAYNAISMSKPWWDSARQLMKMFSSWLSLSDVWKEPWISTSGGGC